MIVAFLVAAVVGGCGDTWGRYCGAGERCCYEEGALGYCCENDGRCCGGACCDESEMCLGNCVTGSMKCVNQQASAAAPSYSAEACAGECCNGECCGKCCSGGHCTTADSTCCDTGGSCPASAPTCCGTSCCHSGASCCDSTCPAEQCCGGCECCTDATTTCSHELGTCIPKAFRFLIPFVLYSWIASIMFTFLLMGWWAYVKRRTRKGYKAMTDAELCLTCGHQHHHGDCTYWCPNENRNCPNCFCGRHGCHRSDKKICGTAFTAKQKQKKTSRVQERVETVTTTTTTAVCPCTRCVCADCMPTLDCSCEACACSKCRTFWSDFPTWLLLITCNGLYLFITSFVVYRLFDLEKYKILTSLAALYTFVCIGYTLWLHITGTMYLYK